MKTILEKINFVLEQTAKANTSYGRQAQVAKGSTYSSYKSSITGQRAAAASRSVGTRPKPPSAIKKASPGPTSHKEWWSKIQQQRKRHLEVMRKRKSANTSGYQSRVARAT